MDLGGTIYVFLFLILASSCMVSKCQDDEDGEEDNPIDLEQARNVTDEEKLDFLSRWCDNEDFIVRFMKTFITCRDTVLTPDQIKKEEECFHKVFGEGKNVKILHEESAEKEFVCASEDKKDLLQKYKDVWACMDVSDSQKTAYWKNMSSCVADERSQMYTLEENIEFLDRWCNKDDIMVKMMKMFIGCREITAPAEHKKAEEDCMVKVFGEGRDYANILHDEGTDREFVCSYKDRKASVLMGREVWKCIRAVKLSHNEYWKDMRKCMKEEMKKNTAGK